MNIMGDMILAIILSIIAGIIFWFIFTFIPDKIKYKKIRPLVELKMSTIYGKLFSYVDLAMINNINSPSMFQEEIKLGKLKKEDIELGLQNKCLNESYLYDENSKILIPIGNTLNSLAKEIDKSIDRIFAFYTFLSADEILLLEDIRNKIFTYDYEDNAVSIISGQEYLPDNPNIGYMSENIYYMYTLFLRLQKIIFTNKYRERGIILELISQQYALKKYKACHYSIKKYVDYYKDDGYKSLLKCYDFLCDYMLNNKNEAYRKIDILLANKLDLISNRSFFKQIIEDNNVICLLGKYFKQDELSYFRSLVESELNSKEIFIEQAKKIRKHYNCK